MRKTRWILAIVFLFGAFGAVSSWSGEAGELTIQAAQREAVEHSPLYLQMTYKEKELGWRRQEAFATFLPHLSLSGIHYFDNKFEQVPVQFSPNAPPTNFTLPSPYTVFALEASLTLFDGFSGVNRFNAAELSRKAADLDAQWAGFQLEQEVRLRYYQAVAARKLAVLALENVKTLEDHMRVVKDQVEAGQATRYDVLRVGVQLDEAQAEKLSSEDNLVLARRKLALSMGLAKDERSLAGELPVPDEKVLLPGLDKDLDQKPDVRSKMLLAQAAAKRGAEAGGFWFPKVSLVGEYQFYDFASRDLFEPKGYPDAYQVGLAASWNLFDGGASLAKEREADEERKQAEASAQEAKLQAPYDLDFWKRRLGYSASLYRARLAEVDKARESVRLSRLGFKAGTRTTTDVLDSELDYFRANAGVVTAQVEAAEALMNVELAVGKRISHE